MAVTLLGMEASSVDGRVVCDFGAGDASAFPPIPVDFLNSTQRSPFLTEKLRWGSLFGLYQ
jgi:hypothetical protein